jgi:hypothetical protein
MVLEMLYKTSKYLYTLRSEDLNQNKPLVLILEPGDEKGMPFI